MTKICAHTSREIQPYLFCVRCCDTMLLGEIGAVGLVDPVGFSFVALNKCRLVNSAMRPSLIFVLLGVAGHFVNGFSSSTSPSFLRTTSSYKLRSPREINKPTGKSSSFSSRGGAIKATGSGTTEKFDASPVLASLWGTGGVAYILLKAIKRVLPIAMEPFVDEATPLSQFQLG